jgi:hypothetical protein
MLTHQPINKGEDPDESRNNAYLKADQGRWLNPERGAGAGRLGSWDGFGSYQPPVPGSPLTGPVTSSVIQPP